MTQEANSHRMVARLFGILFILAFISYGTGSGLVASVADGPDGLAGIFANRTKITIGILLMAIVHSFVNIGLSVLIFEL